MFFLDNIGLNLSVDVTALTIGELYTIITNKVAKGPKGVPIVIIQGTQSENIRSILKNNSESIMHIAHLYKNFVIRIID